MSWPTTQAGWIALVRDWLDVDDTTAVPDSALSTCLDMAVDMMNLDVESIYAEAAPASYTVLSTDTWPKDITALGITDYNKMVNINSSGGISMAAKAINELIDLTSTQASPSATPVAYAVYASQLYMWPIPSTGAIIQLRYLKKIPYLSASVGSNVYTLNHQSAFLYATLIAAEPYIAEDERLDTWKNLYAGQVDAINLVAKKARMGSSPLVRDFNVYGAAAQSSLSGRI